MTMESTSTPPMTPTAPSTPTHTHEDLRSLQKAQSSIESLSSILPVPLPSSLSSSTNPAFSLLHDDHAASQISSLLRVPESGAGDNNLCRWLYDTFQLADPNLQLVVLRFVPLLTGLYLSRVAHRKALAGFEAVLLALYGSESTCRAGQAITVSIPDISHSSIYHESKTSVQNTSTELNVSIISPSLEPHSTVRSTRRAKIVGVALELYFSKISQMPVGSKMEFCEFCKVWAGQDGDMLKEDSINPTDTHQEITITEVTLEAEPEAEPSNQQAIVERENVPSREGRIPLPWKLLQPVLRILGHCLMGLNIKDNALHEAACGACRSLYARSMHDVSPRAILATESLLRLGKMAMVESSGEVDDPTDLPKQIQIVLTL